MSTRYIPDVEGTLPHKPNEEKRIDGMTAYDILHKYPDCPGLPRARSMTQARIDYYHYQDGIIQWYIDNVKNLKS